MNINTCVCLLLVGVAFSSCERSFQKSGVRYHKRYQEFESIDGALNLHIIPTTFNDAFLRCSKEGATLASPLDLDFRSKMMDLMAQFNVSCGIYTGIHSLLSKGDYTSIEGVRLEDIPVQWEAGEPNNVDDKERCLIMLPGGTLADVQCNESFSFICYKTKQSMHELNARMLTTNCNTFDAGYEYDSRTGSCYKYHAYGRSWTNGQKICQAEGGYLVVINNEIESEVIMDIFRKYTHDMISNTVFKDIASIGVFDFGTGGDEYFTIHGQHLTYKKWHNCEPDKSKNGEFICAAADRLGFMQDIWCDHNSLPFICEIDGGFSFSD